ncbi:MAG: hypothetical protein ACPG83_06910 [Candidatus Poseidoniaceae archaeon]
MRTDEELSRIITDSINRKHNSDEGLLSECTSCGNINSIPPTFDGSTAKCQLCGEALQNPRRKVEIDAYKQIKRGIAALIIFSTIMVLPHAVGFFEFVLETNNSNYDSEESETETGIQYASTACDPESDDYDKEECVKDMELDQFIAIWISIGIYSLPIYGLIEISNGVSKLSKFNTTKFD